MARINKVPPNPGQGGVTKNIPASGVTRGCISGERIYMVPPASTSSHPFSKWDKVIPPCSVTKGYSTMSSIYMVPPNHGKGGGKKSCHPVV